MATAVGMSDPYFRWFREIQKKPSSSEHEIENLPSEQCVQHNLIPATASLSHSCSVLGLLECLRISVNSQQWWIWAGLFIINWCQRFTSCQASENIRSSNRCVTKFGFSKISFLNADAGTWKNVFEIHLFDNKQTWAVRDISNDKWTGFVY